MAKNIVNPFIKDVNHYGPMTVRQLVELVESDKSEFPLGLDTFIRIGDVEGNNGVIGDVLVSAHKSDDIVLSVDVHSGDFDYDPEN